MTATLGASLLPRTAAGWTALLQSALRLHTGELHIPEHFYLKELQSGRRFSHLQNEIVTGTKRASAVLVLLSPPTGIAETGFQEMCISLTKRTAKLRNHRGQMSFPGGKVDGGETPVGAAQREALEEVGIDASAYEVIGTLHTIPAFDGSSVFPIVAIATSAVEPRCNSPDEVASIHYLHLSRLLLCSEQTHSRLLKWKSTMLGLPAHFPCFFASASQDLPCGDVFPTPNVPSISEDAGLSPMLSECFPGELVWGLTAFILCELLARISTTLMREFSKEACAEILQLRCSPVIARDLEPPLEKKNRI